MHEWGLVAAAVQDVAARTDGRAPRSVTLHLGPNADAATVRTAWEQAVTDWPLRDTELLIAHERDRLQCLACGSAYAGQVPDACPHCGGDGLVVDVVADLTVGAIVGSDGMEMRPCA